MKSHPEKLHQYLESAIALKGDRTYLKTTGGSHSYNQVGKMSMDFQRILTENGSVQGERVVIYSSKNAASIAVMAACSSKSCIYVPVSSLNPAGRAVHIIKETNAVMVVCDEACATELRSSGLGLEFLDTLHSLSIFRYKISEKANTDTQDTAFILYTSGSTGNPKGVAISHRAAIVFINWAVKQFGITADDILTSIAPFNFDLSVFDIYVSAMTGATLLLYTEQETKNARLMAMKLSEDEATTIYGTPTFYTTLAYFGKLNRYDFTHLKRVLFAGEVFPPESFRKLFEVWSAQKYYNLYGPTETNVCTFYEVDPDDLPQDAFPIGMCCDYAKAILIDADDRVIEPGREGELLIAGQSLFNEYWGDTQKTADSIFKSEDGSTYYRTGDIVRLNDDGDFVYMGRKDRMIKKYGFRIEPSEIENVVVRHPEISIATALLDASSNRLICFAETASSMDQEQLHLREHCMDYLPQYMVPDKFVLFGSMPRTSSGKVDLQALQALL